jgi:hypothetical protein
LPAAPTPRVSTFPANTSAIRRQLLLNSNSEFELAQRIRRQGAPLGELFSFISSLYFRGKLADAKAGFPSTLVVTTSRGLLSPETVITLDDLLEMSAVSIDPGDARYRESLCQDARAGWRATTGSQIVLLGSIAIGKYVDPLLEFDFAAAVAKCARFL